MNFDLTETQQLIQRSVEHLLTDRYDFATRAKHLRSGERQFLWPEFAKLGLLGVEIDECFGGSAGSFEDLTVALAPMGAALVVEPFIACAVVSTGLLSSTGDPAQKAAVLPGIADGSLKVCLAHAERRARDTPSWVETTATREGTGWRLDGAKAVSLGGDQADLFLVSARSSGSPGDTHGLSLFIVPTATAGLAVDRHTLYDGSGAADLSIASVTVPETALLGTADGAYDSIALALDRGAAAVCAESIGALVALSDLTLAYLKNREQFGRPIGAFQVLQHRMADVHMAVELARSMAYLATAAIADADPATRQHKISAAKVTIGRACRDVGQACIQLHGGIGLTDEYAAGHYFKRLTLLERLFGDTDHHLRRYAGVRQ